MLSYTLYKYTEVGEQNCIIALYFFFKETSVFFAIMAGTIHKFTLPLTMHEGYIFFTSSSTLAIFCLFDNKHSDRCEVIYLFMVLIWIFLIISDVNIISFICWSSVHFFFFLKKTLLTFYAHLLSNFAIVADKLHEFFMHFILLLSSLSVMSDSL